MESTTSDASETPPSEDLARSLEFTCLAEQLYADTVAETLAAGTEVEEQLAGVDLDRGQLEQGLWNDRATIEQELMADRLNWLLAWQRASEQQIELTEDERVADTWLAAVLGICVILTGLVLAAAGVATLVG